MNLLIENAKEGWKFYSVWFMALLGLMPDIYSALMALGLLHSDVVPTQAAWAIRIVAILGIVSRFVSQAKPEGLPPEIDPQP